jgi:hypothetical protein
MLSNHFNATETRESLFYVASSRAIQRLTITGVGEKSDLVRLE